MRLPIIAAALVLAPASASAQKLTKADLAAIAATPAQVAAMVTVKNDPLDHAIQVSSEPFFVVKSGLLRMTSGDKFMRAFVDKRTGATEYQFYLWTNYSGDWQFFDRLNYESSSGPVSAEVHKVASKVLGCTRYGCTLQEHIAADIPESVLRQVAMGASPGADVTWKVRVYGRSTEGVTTGILKTEVAGFLMAVDKVRAGLSGPRN